MGIFASLLYIVFIGAGWQQPSIVSNDTFPSSNTLTTANSRSACFSPNTGILHLIYQAINTDREDLLLYTKKTTDGWLSPIPLPTGPVSKEGTFSIASDYSGSYIYTVYVDETYFPHCQIAFLSSSDGGNSWSNSTIISQDIDTTYYYQPDICTADNGKVFVTWMEGWLYYPHHIGLAYSYDYGRSWKIYREIDDSGGGNELWPSIACSKDGGEVYIAWSRRLNDSVEVVMRKFYPNTLPYKFSPFSETKVIARYPYNPNLSSLPVVHITTDANADKIYIFWNYTPNTTTTLQQIYLATSTNDGETWSSPTVVSQSSSVYSFVNPVGFCQINNFQYVDLYVDLVYIGVDENYNRHVFWRRTTNGGISWSTPVEITDHSTLRVSHVVIDNASNSHVLYAFGGEIYEKEYISPVLPRITHFTNEKHLENLNDIRSSKTYDILGRRAHNQLLHNLRLLIHKNGYTSQKNYNYSLRRLAYAT